jgi:serine/threonine protein kinase
VLSVGQILDSRYEVLAPLAEGGMGAVYRARRTLLGDEVAIKIIRADHSGPEAIERFLRESRACAQLRHPNIVSIYDFNADDPQRPFLVMELLSGPSLDQILAARGALTLDDVRTIVPAICSALALAHSRGIVHRDLKPANIVAHEFVPRQVVYKIVDFGLANIRQSTTDARLTAAHQFLGTIAYASPEQLTGGSVDSRSDVYSLGAVIFELVTGRVPFDGGDVLAVLSAHLSQPPPAPRDVRPDLPAWLDEVVLRALAKTPGDRWADIGEMGQLFAARHAERTTRSATVPGMSNLLDTYELGERIGPGRLGSDVYQGVHRALGHPVAIRVLRGGGPWKAAVRARFLREARTLQIVHPSIIHVRDYGEEPDLVYLVTDHIEGVSLRDALKQSGALTWDRLCRLVGHLVEAARVLHRKQGLLCGLTPEIIRITPDDDGERLMISTAGIWDADDLLSTLQEQTVRGTGLADAELRYVAPELLTGQAADLRSDVFTIGVLAYEMATGTLPYDGTSMPALLGQMLRGVPEDPRAKAPTLTPAAAGAILTALRPQPSDRFAGAREFGAAFGV